MARKKYTVEQIISHLREAEVRLGQGATVGAVCRSFGISEQSYYRWRKDRGAGAPLVRAPSRRAA